ncbi:MAG: TonB family protein [Betaproteobacteria bacterium]|nr:TonB family protein [Betaproteobacteria bacterium]MDE2621735.1 TonB family protein [Betaproteobacteria bacterium]
MSASHGRRLGLALGLSLLLHGILLTVFPLHRGPASRTPDTVLDIEFQQAPSPVPLMAPQEAVPEPGLAKARTAPSRFPASKPAVVPAPTASSSPPAPAASTDDLRLRSLQMIRREVVDPFAGQRVRRLSAQTRDEVFGPYEEAYREKVEQVGTVNYPPPVAGRRLYGVVRLTATIRQDGSLALVEIRQSSGSPDLDDAARRIVQMAAPFQPFTPAMRARADLVSITRSFNFIRAGEAIQSQ